MSTSTGYSPIIFDTFESMVTRQSPEKVDRPNLIRAQNCVFVGDDMTIRPGLTLAFTGPDASKPITSINQLTLADTSRSQIAFDGSNVFVENNGVPIAQNVVGPYMEMAPAQHRAYLAFSDLKAAKSAPKVYGVLNGMSFYDPVGLAPNSIAPAASSSPAGHLGDIATGTRYCVVLFKTRTGYIGGFNVTASLSINVTTAGLTLAVSGIPVSQNTNVVSRILAFTQAGASSDGPYFAIEAGDFLAGLVKPVDAAGNNITTTVINDNFTTSIEVSFPDEYLIGALDVTDYTDKITLANQKSAFYAKSLDRLFWCGEDSDTWRVSEPSDFETYMGTTGLMQPAYGDGGIAQTTREFRNEVYLLKDNGGHIVVPTGATPADWSTYPRWTKVGPCGPRAVDVSNEFLVFAHRSGLYVFAGMAPQWVAYNMTGRKTEISWDNINWAYRHLIYVFIDEDNKTVRVGVPMGDSTTPNIEFVVDYSRGWTMVRWSYWDRTASQLVKAEDRIITSPNPATPTDNRVATSQILVAGPAGAVLYEDPSAQTDNGVPIFQNIRLAYSPWLKDPGIYQIGAVDVTAQGEGSVQIVVHPRQDVAEPLESIDLTGAESSDYDQKFQGQNERWSIEVSNGGVLGSWFTLQRIILWVQLVWKTRTV